MGQLFSAIRRSVTAEAAAQFYGMEVNRHHKALCPWHDDKNPSLSFDRKTGRCKCFACNHGGGAVDLTAAIFKISPLEAARRINVDFHLNADDAPAKPVPKGETEAQRQKEERTRLEEEYRKECEIIHKAQSMLDKYSPETTEDNAKFSAALLSLALAQDHADYLLGLLNDKR